MADFSRWGETEDEKQWLREAGFSRRNTRRAILEFLREDLDENEKLVELHSCTYRLQMGYLAVTDQRFAAGMSIAFLPFLDRRRSVALRDIESVEVLKRPWGIGLVVEGAGLRLRVGDLKKDLAVALARRIRDLAETARVAPAPTPPAP